MEAEPTPAAESSTAEFTRLLEYLKISRGFDFGAYKVSSLMRRIQKRMREVGVEGYSAYTDFLEVHPHEFGPLFDTVLINVTSFFRDAPAWDYLAQNILPRLVEEKGEAGKLRIWSAACASGEEAYSLAMLLCEAVGEEAFRQRVKIYATDADEGVLVAARQGAYEPRQVVDVPADFLDKYFEASGSRHIFRNDLRRCLIFGRHDLIQDAAISRLDLLVCRNALMYFNAETQEKILARFHFALNKTGYLFLGKAETLLSHNSFKPVELKHRIFSPAPTSNMRDRLLALTPGGNSADGSRHLRMREISYDGSPVAQVALDRRGYLVLANERARRLFGLTASDLGRLLQDLELSYRPIELRSHIEQAYETRSQVQVREVEWRGQGGADARQFDVQIVPLSEPRGGTLGVSIAFIDLTEAHHLRVDLERANPALETAYEELQSSNEELETTNEELQSTVEELETTNEELQSANEELETMNEELQSTNEELQTVNEELRQRTDELNRANAFLEAVLASLRAAAVVVGRDLNVLVWNARAEDLWGLRADEVRGQSVLNLDIGLPVGELRAPIRTCLQEGAGHQEVTLDAVNRRGKAIRCRVTCTPLMSAEGKRDGVILLMEEAA